MPHHGHGVDLFNRLLRCSEAFKHLVMIRLTAGDEVGKNFGLKRITFDLRAMSMIRLRVIASGSTLIALKACAAKSLSIYL